jgi:guanylate kinase
VFGNYYGTLCREVEPYCKQGVGALLEIDVQGWEQVKRRYPQAVSVFVRTSTLEVLEERLRKRRTETEEELNRRLDGARLELARAPDYDFQVINDDLNVALASLRAIIAPLFEGKRHAG